MNGDHQQSERNEEPVKVCFFYRFTLGKSANGVKKWIQRKMSTWKTKVSERMRMCTTREKRRTSKCVCVFFYRFPLGKSANGLKPDLISSTEISAEPCHRRAVLVAGVKPVLVHFYGPLQGHTHHIDCRVHIGEAGGAVHIGG